MASTTAPPITVAAKRPPEPPKTQPSKTQTRTSPEEAFKAALRAATNEAMIAQVASSPSAAKIAAPVASPSDGQTNQDNPLTTSVDARLWESLGRSAPLLLGPAAMASIPNLNNVESLEPATQAISPVAARERGQEFLASIKGFDQTLTSEYESPAQARAWGYSTCSAASLTAVLRAAGQDVKIADVMKAMPGGMTIKLGLVSRPALMNAASQFGARATEDVTSYESLKAATDNGQPVLVDLRNSRFPEGHWIVVTGVDENGIRCADSSRYDLTSIPRGEFQRSWSGRGIRLEGLTPSVGAARANAA